jgi:hypothetical protein
MLEVLHLFLLLLAMLAPAVALGWVYWRTRLPAALVYLGWHLLGPSLLGSITRGILATLPGHSEHWFAFQELALLASLLAKGIGAVLFIWLLVSLMRPAQPETVGCWRPPPVAAGTRPRGGARSG